MKVGLIGCGNIGGALANSIGVGEIEGAKLICVFDTNQERAKKFVEGRGIRPIIAKTFNEFLDVNMDVVIEAASQNAVRDYVVKVLGRGYDVVVMSSGALLDSVLLMEVNRAVKEGEGRVYVPSGAICGLDGVKSASIGEINEVILTTRKPPSALRGVEYLIKKGVDVDNIKKPTKIYEGVAEEAAKRFPHNINVCAALSLSGIGPKKTKVIIFIDPEIKRNTHQINVKGEFGELYSEVKNVPSPNNPKTSYLACLSAIRTLKEIDERIKIGT